MTLTTELPAEVEQLLRLVAQERSVSVEQVVANRLNFNLSEEELEDLEDELGVAQAQRRLAAENSDDYKTLDGLRRALRR